MSVLTINKSKCNLCGECQGVCPFGSISIFEDSVVISPSCRMCRICIKKCPQNAIAVMNEQRIEINKEDWTGIMVYVEYLEGDIHPVTYELIGKAKELGEKIKSPVYCMFIGSNIENKAKELLYYGVDKVYIYDYEELRHYRVDIYANAFEDCINRAKPSIVLVGATSVGRSLAPRVSTRFRTGLTADCTKLDVRPNSDLVQIRPAFGGNIMAQIVTPGSRPQFATVRYKVMDSAAKNSMASGEIVRCSLEKVKLASFIKVVEVIHKQKAPSISDAEVIVAAGRGIKDKKDISMIEELAALLGGQVAVTRPMVEAGWASYTRQIGLSGRTVKPRLIITCGISGAVQFTACMNTAERIIAINKDKNAPIFKVAHYGIVGDVYEIIPALIKKIKEGNTIEV